MLVERSVKSTDSGAEPLVGEPVKSATGGSVAASVDVSKYISSTYTECSPELPGVWSVSTTRTVTAPLRPAGRAAE